MYAVGDALVSCMMCAIWHDKTVKPVPKPKIWNRSSCSGAKTQLANKKSPFLIPSSSPWHGSSRTTGWSGGGPMRTGGVAAWLSGSSKMSMAAISGVAADLIAQPTGVHRGRRQGLVSSLLEGERRQGGSATAEGRGGTMSGRESSSGRICPPIDFLDGRGKQEGEQLREKRGK